MNVMIVYLDNSSTTRPYDEVTKRVVHYMSLDYGNPSSLHELGLVAEGAVEKARQQVGESLGKKPEGIVFTSGGTEADNMAIFGVAEKYRRKKGKIVTTRVEHPAIMRCMDYLEAQGWNIHRLGVDEKGFIRPRDLEDALDQETVLVSVMLVNNEVGTILAVEEMATLVKQYNYRNGTQIWFHTDAVQGLGKVKIPEQVDLISISGHKIHGPKGIGALWIQNDLSLPPFIYGGGQEGGRRSGTENVPAIVGFGEAALKSQRDLAARQKKMQEMKTYLYAGLSQQVTDIGLNGGMDAEKFSPAILNVSFLGVRGEVLLHMLEEKGIYVSTGSACSSHHKGDSPVLTAMGLTREEIQGAIRFSFSEDISYKQLDYVIDAVHHSVHGMRRIMNHRNSRR